MGKQTVNILYQSSDMYAPYTGVSITSLFENNKHLEDIHVYLLDDGISEGNKEKFRALSRQYGRTISFIDTVIIKRRIEKMKVKPWKESYTSYFKLFSIGLLDKDIDRLLYIDSDTIIHRAIDGLYHTELDGKLLAMVQDINPPVDLKAIGIKKGEYYYNAGVILFDAGLWRESDCEKLITDHLSVEHKQYLLADQDILNILFRHKTKRLEPEFNYIAYFLFYGIEDYYYMWGLNELGNYYEMDDVAQKGNCAVIYHFLDINAIKPWLLEKPLSEIYRKYILISPWKGLEAQKNRPFTTKVQLCLRKVLPHRLFTFVYRHYREYVRNKVRKVQGKV